MAGGISLTDFLALLRVKKCLQKDCDTAFQYNLTCNKQLRMMGLNSIFLSCFFCDLIFCNQSVVKWIEHFANEADMIQVLWFDSRSDQTKDYKNWYSQSPCFTLSNKRDNVKPSPCVVDWWAGGSLTRRPKGPYAVSWPRCNLVD